MYDKIKKIFALSDVHGFYTPMKTALDAAGFDPEDESHLLVFCGDMFDRGSENLAVYRYLTGLKNKVLIRGNHDERMTELLLTRRVESHDYHNRTTLTLTEFFGEGCIDGNGMLDITDRALADDLLSLYASEQNYFSFGKFVFTHGWLPSTVIGGTPYLLENWQEAEEERWSAARWYEWQQIYARPEYAMIPGKTVVCGHRPAAFGCWFDRSRGYDDYGIFYGDGLIAIDGWTVRSGIVNVLVLNGNT